MPPKRKTKKKVKKKKGGAELRRILKNRAFVGAFIADPEGAAARYRLSIPTKDLSVLAGHADRLAAHVSKTLIKGSAALLDCSDGCALNC